MSSLITDIAIGFVLGVVVGVVARSWTRKGNRLAVKHREVVHSDDTGMVIGGARIPIVTCARGPWSNNNIICHNHLEPVALEDAVRDRIDKIADEARNAVEAGQSAPFNGHGYGLRAFDVSRRTIAEEPMLELTFSPTDYFTMLATDCQLDAPLVIDGAQTTLRQRYATKSMRESPISGIASTFGVTIQFVTADGLTAFVRRGPTATEPHAMFCSMGEAAGPFDVVDGVLNPASTAVRGIEEEYGISIRADQVEWTAFLATVSHGQYHLSAIVRLPMTGDELLAIHSAGAGKDHWEIGTLYLCPFEPHTVAHFLSQEPGWVPLGVATIYHALVSDFGWESTAKAFSGSLLLDTV
jgi:hypothetical protein